MTEYNRVDGDHAWRVVAQNGQYMAIPGEGFRRVQQMRRSLWNVGEAIMLWMAERNLIRFKALAESIAARITEREA